jgi:HAD superfamily hydrolase (TIGR01509 family)
MFDAVVSDFDGLILDTETPLYQAWHRTFAQYGVNPIPLDEWNQSLGRADDDPLLIDPIDRLLDAVGPGLSVQEAQQTRRRHRDELLSGQDLRPGIIGLLDEADQLRVPIALASSSPIDWIERHLAPRELLSRFAAVSCAGNGVPGKPDPAVYLAACAAVNATPRRSLAFEDSPNGATAAKDAGMFCVVVPNQLGAELDFSHADHVQDRLSDASLTSLFNQLSAR